MSPISVAARHRSPAVGNRLICCIKNFLTNFEIGHIGSQLIDLAQSQHVFVGWHAGMLPEYG